MKTVTSLKKLLANMWVLFFIARNAHVNIQGATFLTLHAFFQEIYDGAYADADTLSECIRQHREFSMESMEHFINLADVKHSAKPLSLPSECLNEISAANKMIIDQIASTMKELENDEATMNMLAGMIEARTKLQWKIRMLTI